METLTLTCRGTTWNLRMETRRYPPCFKVHLPSPLHRDAELFFNIATAASEALSHQEKHPVKLLAGHIGPPECWLILG